MALFDQFGASQASNGQPSAPNPQVASGAPGFQAGSWGNQPPNMAGGLQQFLAARGTARPQMGALAPAGAPPGAQPGMFGAPTSASQLPPAGMPQSGNPMQQQQPVQGAPAAVMPQGAAMQPAGGASSPYGNTSFAGGMQQFLGARPN